MKADPPFWYQSYVDYENGKGSTGIGCASISTKSSIPVPPSTSRASHRTIPMPIAIVEFRCAPGSDLQTRCGPSGKAYDGLS